MRHIARRLFREENPGNVTYQIKGIPDALWKAVRLKALGEDTTVKEVLLLALHDYIGR